MGQKDEDGGGAADQRTSLRGLAACAERGCPWRVGATDHRVQNLGDREELHQGSVSKCFVMIGQGAQVANHL